MAWYIPEDSAIYYWSMDWRVPLSTSLIYALVVAYASRRNSRRAAIPTSSSSTSRNDKLMTDSTKSNSQTRLDWNLFRISVVAHNLLLMAFSAFTFYQVTPLLLASFRYRPFFDAFCDVGGWVYRHGLGFWTWMFYISKYYELLDTAILLAKGKPSSFLQTFHHAGAIISMWMLTSTRAFGAWVFVVFNSFIHTIMYFYYTLTCLGYQPTWKRLMTYMQLTQFFVGLPLAVAYAFVPKCIPLTPHPKDALARILGMNGYWSKVIALALTFTYVAYLIVLFLDFARRTYKQRPRSTEIPPPSGKSKKV